MRHRRIGLDDLHQLRDGVLHEGERRVLRPLHTADNRAGVLLREEPLGNPVNHHHIQRYGKGQHNKDQHRIIERPCQRMPVDRQQPVEKLLARPIEDIVLFALVLVLQQVRAHHRRGGQRDDHRNDDRNGKRHCEFAEEPPDDAAHHENRNEDGNQRHADGKHREADLARAHQRGIERRHPALQMPRDVFHHHNGVVDDEPRGDGQRHQRKIVDAVAEQVHHRERPDQRNRNGDAGDERGAWAAQEDEHHQHHQHHGGRQRPFYVATEARIVVVRSSTVVTLIPCGSTAVRNGSCSRMLSLVWMMFAPGLAEDDDEDGPRAVHVARGAQILRGVVDAGDIGEPNRRPVVITHNQRAVILGLRNLIVGDDVGGHRAIGKLPARRVRILQAQNGLHAAHGQPKALQLRRIDFDAHRRCSAPANTHLPHPVNLRKLLLEDG